MTRTITLLVVAACTSSTPPPSSTTPDASTGSGSATQPRTLGTVGDVHGVSPCTGAPAGASCMEVTVTGCPGIEAASATAIVAIVPGIGTRAGTIVHFSGGGGTTFNELGLDDYRDAHFQQVFVRWIEDWETTTGQGIKVAACRPATLIKWIFDSVHAADRTQGYCVEGHSGGTGQITYALAHYGLGDTIDYANLISGPPFARIDLGCDGDAPATATVCGAPVTMKLRASELDRWENNESPVTCGGSNIPASELERWKQDSIVTGGTFVYPHTQINMYDCTNRASATTGMGQLYYDAVAQATGADPERASYHCYSAADDCHGEGIGAMGQMQVVAAMLGGCHARHM